MDRYRPYRGHSGTSHRRRASAGSQQRDKSSKRAIKLIICIALFAIAAFMKLVFPAALQSVGDKLNTVVNYKAALASLGEGISGQKSFTAALGEAFTYAFTGTPSNAADNAAKTTGTDGGKTQTAPPAALNTPATKNQAASATGDGKASSASQPPGTAVETFSQTGAGASPDNTAAKSTDNGKSAEQGISDSDKTFSDAVVAAFQQSQEQYSDYAIPAGVSYEMPKIGISYMAPVKGVVSSPFGYRFHPTEKAVKFHYGTDVAAKEGTPIVAFADGKVIAAGKSSSYGNYIIISHSGGIESEYAHCQKLLIKEGQAVKKGDKIATVGKTGNATDDCLHFELRVSGVYVNPEFYIRQWV